MIKIERRIVEEIDVKVSLNFDGFPNFGDADSVFTMPNTSFHDTQSPP